MSLDRAENSAAASTSLRVARTKSLALPTRFAFWPRAAALAALVLLVLAEVFGLLAPPTPPASHAAPTATAAPTTAQGGDLLLYQNIIRDMRNGETYYAAAARELRGGDYPLRPFVAFRPPLLAEFLAHAPEDLALVALRIVVVALAIAWTVRLRPAVGVAPAVITACLILASLGGQVALFGETRYLALHEMWAGLLVALSLALRTPERWIGAAVVGALAALIRELAVPYIALMAAAALYEGRRREGAGWCAVIGLFAVVTGYHAIAASAVASATDRVSPGWAYLGGWRFFLTTAWLTGVLRNGPYFLTAIVTPLALLGWAGWRDAVALRAFGLLAGYAILMMVFARPDNFYWALIVAPLAPIGLVFAPRSLQDLVARTRGELASSRPQP
jgi:hypothetical protein